MAQTSSTSKEVKHVFTKKHAVMAAFTIVLLCIVIIPVSLFFAPSYSPSHDVPPTSSISYTHAKMAALLLLTAPLSATVYS